MLQSNLKIIPEDLKRIVYLGGVSWQRVCLIRVFWKLKTFSACSSTQCMKPRSIRAVRREKRKEEREDREREGEKGIEIERKSKKRIEIEKNRERKEQ